MRLRDKMEDNNNSNKRVLVTGAAGFVGSHFIEHVLKNTDWDIIAMVRTSTAGDLHRLGDNDVVKSYPSGRVKLVYHNLVDAIPNHTSAKIGLVDYIVHFAANSHVQRSIEEPVPFVYDTVVGTVNLLEWARLGGLKSSDDGGRFFNFGTDEQFGPASDVYNFKECDAWRPSNPYAAAKCGQAAFGYSYFVTFGLPVISTQTMNIFGERQNPEKLISKAMQKIYNGEEMTIHCKISANADGDGVDETNDKSLVSEIGQRHWLHVRNVSSAILFLLDKGVPGEFYNVCGFDEFDNEEIVRLVAKAMAMEDKLKLKYLDFHKARPGHDRRYALDGSKLANLGWVPPVKFEESLDKMVRWTLDNPQWMLGGE